MFNTIILNERQKCDLELILNKGFNPIKGFLNKKDYYSVLKNMTLSNGDLWTIPINLSINQKQFDEFKKLKQINEVQVKR